MKTFKEHLVNESSEQDSAVKKIMNFWEKENGEKLSKAKDKRFPDSVRLNFPESDTDYVIVNKSGGCVVNDGKSDKAFSNAEGVIKHLAW